MQFLHLLVFVSLLIGPPLFVLVAGAAAGVMLKRLRHGASADVHPGWKWLVMIAMLASAVWGWRTAPDDEAELAHLLAKAFTYRSTHIELRLREDSPQARRELVRTLTPLMMKGSHRIRYSYRRRTARDDVPAHYRFHDGRMEIAMGGVLRSDDLAPIVAALEGMDRLADLPERVAARLRMPWGPVEVELLPLTSEVVGRPRHHFARKAFPDDCHVTMQALFSSDQFKALFTGSYEHAARQGEIAVVTPDKPLFAGDGYLLIGATPVPGDGGRPVRELDTDATRIFGSLMLRPAGFDPGRHADCSLALLEAIDPLIPAASLATQLPALPRHVESASIRPAARFSPWYAGDGWIEVTPEDAGVAARYPCTHEQELRLRATAAFIKAECRDQPDGLGCERWNVILEDATERSRSCRIEQT